MLKRYTHLKAQRLVRKLEGQKHRGRQVVIDQLVPYPAAIVEEPSAVTVRFLDFDDLSGQAATAEAAIQVAQDALLRRILSLMRQSEPIPTPDQYLESIDEGLVVMVDPLATEGFATFLTQKYQEERA